MLKHRVATAAVLIPVMVAAVLLLPVIQLAYLFGIFAVIAAWEWSRLSGFTSLVSRLAYAGIVILIMVNTYQWIHEFLFLRDILFLVFVGWLFTLVWLAITPAEEILSNAVNVYTRGLVGLLLLVPCWLALLSIHASGEHGPYRLLALFVLVWLADSGAYFTGKLMGVTKLAPLISPGKTLQGVYGALVISLLGALLIGHLFGFSGFNLWAYCGVALLSVVFSIVGDLFESVAKRSAGLKDSGSLFPGHGGVMDRIDGYTAAAPLNLLGLSWFPELLY
jgi:phosphatidate cytidylyltransferase